MTVVMPVYIINEEILTITQQAITAVLDGQENIKLIIIDNASTIGGGYLRSIADIYVRNSENLGFAKACNQGIKLAQTDLVAIASNDTRPSPNWKKVAEETLRTYEAVTCHFRMTDYNVPFKYGSQTWAVGKERWCTAAFFVINKRYDFLFDEKFFNSFEDWDLYYRIRKAGYKTAYTNKACFQHNHSFTQKFTGFKGTDENRVYFKKKHGKDPDELLAELYPEQVKEDYYGGFSL